MSSFFSSINQNNVVYFTIEPLLVSITAVKDGNIFYCESKTRAVDEFCSINDTKELHNILLVLIDKIEHTAKIYVTRAVLCLNGCQFTTSILNISKNFSKPTIVDAENIKPLQDQLHKESISNTTFYPVIMGLNHVIIDDVTKYSSVPYGVVTKSISLQTSVMYVPTDIVNNISRIFKKLSIDIIDVTTNAILQYNIFVNIQQSIHQADKNSVSYLSNIISTSISMHATDVYVKCANLNYYLNINLGLTTLATKLSHALNITLQEAIQFYDIYPLLSSNLLGDSFYFKNNINLAFTPETLQIASKCFFSFFREIVSRIYNSLESQGISKIRPVLMCAGSLGLLNELEDACYEAAGFIYQSNRSILEIQTNQNQQSLNHDYGNQAKIFSFNGKALYNYCNSLKPHQQYFTKLLSLITNNK